VKRVVSVAVVLLVALCLRAGPSAAPYYVQLIVATDSKMPPLPGAKPAGPKVARKCNLSLRPKTFWEVRCREVVVHPGAKVKVSLSKRREIEIEVSGEKRTVTTFYDGRAVMRATEPRRKGMTVIGDGGEEGRLWFIVVRRDKPGS